MDRSFQLHLVVDGPVYATFPELHRTALDADLCYAQNAACELIAFRMSESGKRLVTHIILNFRGVTFSETLPVGLHFARS